MNTSISRPAPPPPPSHFPARPKRSASAMHESHPLSYSEPFAGRPLDASRTYDFGDDSTHEPITYSESVLERTYLDDVVRPLVRSLVKARMTYESSGQTVSAEARHYADLERLRGELEKSTLRARHAEQERDDLARRFDLAGASGSSYRESDLRDTRAESAIETYPHQSRYQSASHGSARGHYQGQDAARAELDRRNDAHGEILSKTGVAPAEAAVAEQVLVIKAPVPATSTSGTYGGAVLSHYPAYSEMAADQERGAMHGQRGPSGVGGSEQDVHHHHHHHTSNGRDRWVIAAPPVAPARPLYQRYSDPSAHSMSSGGSYPTSASERSANPTASTHPTSSLSSHNSSLANSHYEQETEEVERARKQARTNVPQSISLPSPANLNSGHFVSPSNHPITPATEPSSYPIRKLAATKNRTCSSCAAPHDAKFRRGPNGPGTLCDRCGSRFKKYKEQESQDRASPFTKREQSEGFTSGPASAKSVSRTRFSSSSSSNSQSPMDGASASHGISETQAIFGEVGNYHASPSNTSSAVDGGTEQLSVKQKGDTLRTHSGTVEDAMEN